MKEDKYSCTIGIKGQSKTSTPNVDIWFDSIRSVASVLSEDNINLLSLIDESKPQTITEIAKLTGRAVSNLSRTIKTLEKYGFISLKNFGKKITPKVKYRKFNIICNLTDKKRDTTLLTTHTYSLVSMFTGVGGLDMGFEGGFEYMGRQFIHQPFKTLAAYEKDEKCVQTIQMNLDIPIQHIELSEDLVDKFPAAEVLIGGFPCQDFSSCGPKKGLSSDRGQLYKVLARYMSIHKPKIVCAENVPNLARMHNGEVLKTIIHDFEKQGYKVQVWDLFAPDYGVPQSRRRLFFICTRNDLVGEPIMPIPRFIGNHRGTKWAIGDLELVLDESIPNQSQYFKASKAKKGNGQGDEHCKADEPSYTIRANAKSRVQFHYSLDRRLTIRECARLQTFPDSFVFPHSATSNVMQIGNAVPPVLSYAVASSIREFLESQK
ncbi:DNA (cytosine-5-)-methyltransferase [Aeromonas schubertii]|uniref:DNA (cytosine-5-)-methyltransferase n=1 Tax=Aeromonas schubertii TaxID=652 RepID=UPI000AFB803D|nr:DNA (cytosine-5-)-methyltransferase [Aeromonas schubertii]